MTGPRAGVCHSLEPSDQSWVLCHRVGVVEQSVELLVVAGGVHVELHPDGVFLAGCVTPPLALEGQQGALVIGQHPDLLLWGEGVDDDVLHGLGVVGDVHHVAGKIFDALEALRGVGKAAGGFLDSVGELHRQGGFQADDGGGDGAVSTEFPGDFHAVSGVRIDHDAAVLPGAADGIEAVLVGGAAGEEPVLALDAGEGGVGGEVEVAFHRQLVAEEIIDAGGVAIQQVGDEALEVGGLGDVHGGAGGGQRLLGGAHSVNAGGEELVEHVVFVGDDDEAVDGHTHGAGDVPGADIAEVAGGHGEADFSGVALGGVNLFGEADPAADVVDDLGHESRPVDGVDGADAPGALELEVAADVFDNVLAVIEDAVNGHVDDVGVLDGEHLGLLEGGHAAPRGEHEDANAVAAAHGVFGGGAGVAGGGAQDIEDLVAALEFVLEEFAEQLHSHVFEGGGGAVGEAADVDIVFQVLDGDDLFFGELGGAVGAGADVLEILGGDVVDEEGEDVGGEGCVALLVEEVTPAVEVVPTDGGVLLRQVEAAVGGEAFQQDVAEAGGGLVLVASR